MDMVTPGAVLLSALNPAILGVLISFQQDGRVPPLLTLFLLLIPTAANCAVNLLNDYYDYIGGNDTAENIVAEAEGPLAYHEVEDPAPALYYGIAFFAAACLMGVYVVYRCGPIPAAIGIFGAVITATYSGRWISTSHMPVGELLSGFTMGGLIPLAVYVSLTGRPDWIVLWKSVPMMLVVSQFMLENNTCDMERDAAAGRRTLPMFLGRGKAEALARVLGVFWLGQLIVLVAVYFPFGLPVLAAALWMGRKGITGMFRETRTRENKIPATLALAEMAFWVSEGYLASVAVQIAVQWIRHSA
ncbi:MAG: prenyltransferase [Eubacteriales bacterium]|nr:prenyltransferase [Eubacteriales bacterium]